MKQYGVYGYTFPEYGWVPAPSYLLRRWAILRLIKNMTKGRVIEFGCASGALLIDLTEIGFTCTGVEISDRAYQVSHKILSNYSNIRVYKSIPENSQGCFEYVMAFEVLEHIEDEANTLLQWKELLAKGGKLIISVPAHKNKWTASDEWAGHYRRYAKKDIVELLQVSGFKLEEIICYGFPLKNIIDSVRGFYHKILLKKNQTGGSIDRTVATKSSGIERSLENKLFFLYCNSVCNILFKLAFKFQSLFCKTNLGGGFIAVARKDEQ